MHLVGFTTETNLQCTLHLTYLLLHVRRDLVHHFHGTATYILLLTYLLTPWSRVLLEKLTGLQLVKKFLAFYGNRKFMTDTCPYPEPARYSPYPNIPLPEDPS